jgi:hypothetical protein
MHTGPFDVAGATAQNQRVILFQGPDGWHRADVPSVRKDPEAVSAPTPPLGAVSGSALLSEEKFQTGSSSFPGPGLEDILDKKGPLMSGKNRFDKVLAVAINPGAYEQEAVAALHKVRELVKREPNLAFDLPSMAGADIPDEASSEAEISGITEFWLPIVINSLSERAYVLKLKSKFTCDLATPTTVHVKCDGAETACEAFKEHLHVLAEYIHSRQCEPRPGAARMKGSNP